MKVITLCLVTIICFVYTANAQLYKWVDEEGVTHYSNKRPVTMKNVETRQETQSNQPHNKNNKKLDHLLNSYRTEAIQENVKTSQSNGNKTSKSFDQEKFEYYENRIKNKEKIVHRYSDDLRDVKRKPHKDYRSHKKKLRYYEDRLQHAQIDLEDAQREYDDYKSSF